MKTTAILLGALFVTYSLSAQESKTFKTKFSGAGKSIVINIDAKQLDIEGYNGDEVMVEASDTPEMPKEANGLRPLSSAGVENTSIGLTVNANGNTLNISSVLKGKTTYKMRIPKEVGLVVKKRNSCSCNEVGMSISKMEGPLEINTNYEDISLNDVTGPVVANSNNGKISVVFNEKMPDKPSSLATYGKSIDLTIPEKSKVLFSISSSNGNMFTDLDLKPYTSPVKEEKAHRGPEEKSVRPTTEMASSVTVTEERTVNVAKPVTAQGYSYSTITPSASNPSVYYWNGNDWTTNQAGYAVSNWSDYDRNSSKYVLNDPQTKISIKTNQGNIYLRKKK